MGAHWGDSGTQVRVRLEEQCDTCEQGQLGVQRLQAGTKGVVHAIAAGVPLRMHSRVLARPRRLHGHAPC